MQVTRVFVYISLFFCLSPQLANSAEETPTHRLSEVQVEAEHPAADVSQFSESFEWSLPSDSLRTHADGGSLSDHLSRSTPIFFKENGSGMLSTISLRGTSASHTSVCWEGVPINSKTMGQVDFSLLPVLFFDDVHIYPGGEGAVYGNGAIGGAITLSGSRPTSDTLSFQNQTAYGSYDFVYDGMKLSVAKKRISSQTALFFRRSDNDFKFSFRGEEKRQRNASFYDYGMLENLSFRTSEKSQLNLHLWHTFYDRDIQPMMQNNDDRTKYESISNRTSRILLGYACQTPFTWQVKAGWMADDQRYEDDLIATDQLLCLASVRRAWRVGKVRWSARLGCDLTSTIPEVYAYADTATEFRTDCSLLTKWIFGKRFTLTANLRKMWVTDADVPTPFSFNGVVNIFNEKRQNVALGAGVSRNVNVPSLNDKYWGRRSSKDLLTECGLNVEASAKYALKIDRYAATLRAAAYRNDVENWILWLPRGNVWKPMNVARVLARGIEATAEQTIACAASQHWLTLSFQYNHSEVMEGFKEMQPFVGRQLPLLPEYSFSAVVGGKVRHWHYSVTLKGVGERHTSDVFDILQPYLLMDAELGYGRVHKGGNGRPTHGWDIGVRFNNLLDAYYQVMPFRAMPSRNFLIFAKYSIGQSLSHGKEKTHLTNLNDNFVQY